LYLCNTNDSKWNCICVYTIYTYAISQTWSIHFLSDSLDTGGKTRIFNATGGYNYYSINTAKLEKVALNIYK